MSRNIAPVRSIVAIAIGLLGSVVASPAAETCHGYGTQYGDFRICVSSVLASRDGRHGPQHLSGGSGEGAWCEGVPGHGAGETITEHLKPAMAVSTMVIVNGYNKSPTTFRENGRVKRARLETSGGHLREITLNDSGDAQHIQFPSSRVSWIRLTILDVYPGAKYQDTCMSMFSAAVDG